MARKSKSRGGNCKMSASLAILVASHERPTVLGEPSTLTARRVTPSAVPTYHVLVRTTDPDTRSIAGIKLAQGTGAIKTAIVPAAKLQAFVEDEKLERVSAPRRLRPLMDIAGPLVGAPRYAAQNGVSGQGVIIGIVDTGIDASHPAFAGRILNIWDQEIPGQGPGAGFSKLGTVLSGAAFVASSDLDGHGTHVAGIAAGALPPYSGIAAGAKFLIVKTNFQNSAIVEGVRWIFSEAEKLGRPCVVNLSLGAHYDGHDGEDDTSVAIGDECGAGRLVVAAAGNEGGDPIHTRQTLGVGGQAAFGIQVQPRKSPLAAPSFLINGWYSGKSGCEVRVTSSSGVSTSWQGLLSSDPAATATMLGNDRVIVSTPDTPAPNGDRQFLVEVAGQGSPVQGGSWRIEIRLAAGDPSAVDMWLLLDEDRRGSAAFESPVFDTLIGSPGASHEVITVGAYTCRNEWTDIAGSARSVGLIQGTVSEFSSPGPLRGGTLKPDVTAPGAMIVSCLSSTSKVEKEEIIAPGYCVMAGTSMASPVITGLLALYLETHPNATPADAKTWLRQHANVPHAPVGTHDIKWGYGLIRV